MDSIVASGAAALMAIRVLLDHDVPEENISLGKKYSPGLKLCCSSIGMGFLIRSPS